MALIMGWKLLFFDIHLSVVHISVGELVEASFPSYGIMFPHVVSPLLVC